jgi:hypothetical protein
MACAIIGQVETRTQCRGKRQRRPGAFRQRGEGCQEAADGLGLQGEMGLGGNIVVVSYKE